ncbi:MAG: type II secretion system GspH family protein [Fimbriimonadaceae bacterium]|nr:type II secretion system protein [Chthonomonadaceae bacterium]MCO5296531.1 type II secretion system GspH family protein [Fimbriimonadaceae bacterium]
MARRTLRGTTLVELLLTITLVGIFSATLMSALSAGSFKVERARQRAVALGIAREKIEEQRVQARSGSMSTGASSTVVSRASGVGPFSVTRSISSVTTGGISGLFKVNVQVSWTANNGATDQVVLELWIRDYDE